MARKPKAPKTPYHEEVAQRLLDLMKQGVAPWQKPWKPGVLPGMPRNAKTGKPYRGMNAMWLHVFQPTEDPRWMTYKQAQELGAQVKKGAKSTSIQYWKFTDSIPEKDESGKPRLDEKGRPIKKTVRLKRPRCFFARVFHASDVEGLEPYVPEPAKEAWERHEEAERLVALSDVPVFHDQINRAFYRVLSDDIHLPPRDAFPTADAYYATLLHEIGHSTGHPTRLNRDMSGGFGSEDYAREELRAEMASYMLAMELGIGHDPGQHAAYLQSWVRKVQEDPNEIFRAARDAQDIVDMVMGLEVRPRQTVEVKQESNLAESNDLAFSP